MSELPQHCMSYWKGVLAAQEQPGSVSSHPKMPYLGCVQASFYGTRMVTWIHSSVNVHLAFSVGQCKAGTHGKYTQVLKIICLGCWIATVNIYTSIVSIGAYKASESASLSVPSKYLKKPRPHWGNVWCCCSGRHANTEDLMNVIKVYKCTAFINTDTCIDYYFKWMCLNILHFGGCCHKQRLGRPDGVWSATFVGQHSQQMSWVMLIHFF